jgi:hypothetical protein
MVTVQPSLAEVVKNFVFGYFLWRQMVVVVNNGHVFGILMVEQPCRLTLQHEILGEEGLGSG